MKPYKYTIKQFIAKYFKPSPEKADVEARINKKSVDYIKLGRKHLWKGQYQKAFNAFQSEIDRHPNKFISYKRIADIYQGTQDWQRAYDVMDEYASRFPNHVETKIAKGMLLTKIGKIVEAKELLFSLKDKCQKRASMWKALAVYYFSINKSTESLECWAKAVECDPKNLKLLSSYIISLVDNLEVEKALALYEAHAGETKDIRFLITLPRIYLNTWELEKAWDEIQKLASQWPNDYRVVCLQSDILINKAQSLGDSKYVCQALSLLEDFSRANPNHILINAPLARIYIYLRKDEEASKLISNLPTAHNVRKHHLILKSWQKYYQKDITGAKQVWETIQQRHYVRSLQCEMSKLERLDINPLILDPDNVFIFSVMYNEKRRLAWFLDYYRKMGVTRFFIVDNASTDGSREFLLQQQDVHLFLAEGRYAEAMSGMRWLNHLVEHYGKDQWCMYVDADEALVYPYAEKFGLQHLTGYMKDNGHEALRAYMVDMHSGEEETHQQDKIGNPISSYPLFNSDYEQHGDPYCPYWNYSGGARNIFDKPHLLVKTPIIRGGLNIRYISSSHRITPAVISDVTGVMLHFKMTGDFIEHIKSEIDRNNRPAWCMRRHQKYLDTIEREGLSNMFVNEHTTSYESSEQLIALGLIQTSEAYAARSNVMGDISERAQL